MIVIKFGGTSVGDTTHLRRAIEIVAERAEEQPVVVVSALSGVTNSLVDAGRVAAAGRFAEVEKIIDGVRCRHEEIAFELVQQKSDFLASFNAQLQRHVDEILTILRGVALLRELTPRAADKIVAIGEKLSSVLFAYTMRLRTLAGVHVDAEEIVVTDEHFGAANPDMDATRTAARRLLLSEIERGHIPVVGGFMGRSKSGATTTLGRGGSDFSAAILGAALDAKEIQIWTDVDGMMTCDPRVIPGAKIVDRISYVEAAELAYFGAKVLHPKTIVPAVDNGIPIRVLNTHNPSSGGTLISVDGKPDARRPRAIAMKKGIAIVHITSETMLGAHGFLSRIFDVFSRLEVPVDLVTTSEVSVSVTIDQPDRLDDVIRGLAPFARVETESERAIIAVVGRGILTDGGSGENVFRALHGFDISMVSLGRSGMNLSVVVAEAEAERAIRALHEELFEREDGR